MSDFRNSRVRKLQLFIWITAGLATACGPLIHPLHVNDQLNFSQREENLPSNVAVLVTPEAQGYVLKYEKVGPLGPTNNWLYLHIGEALVPNAYQSLSRIFNEVTVIDQASPQMADFIVELAVDERSTIDMGHWEMSDKKMDLYLHAVVKNNEGNVIVDEIINSRTEEGNPHGWMAGLTVFGKAHASQKGDDAVLHAVERGLIVCLETLNDLILAKCETGTDGEPEAVTGAHAEAQASAETEAQPSALETPFATQTETPLATQTDTQPASQTDTSPPAPSETRPTSPPENTTGVPSKKDGSSTLLNHQ